MCGIAGLLIYRPQAPPDQPGKLLRKMLDSMRHRGPDDRGEEKLPSDGGPVMHLGHQRLAVIDLSPGGHQPMPNGDQTLWIAANSEIYNFRELKDELAGKYTFRSRSDTEVLLAAYEAWGIDCLAKLRGMFAFAIWDRRKRLLFLARDRLGIKPLYYYPGENCFLFASEVRGIRASRIPRDVLNPDALYHYLSFGNLAAPQTLLSPIQELHPGHYLQVTPEKWEEKPYWSPLPEPGPGAWEESFPDRVRKQVEESVRVRLVSDAPLGAFLSGGIDSSAVVRLASEKVLEPLRTLSVVFQEQAYDESEFSSLVARDLGTRHDTLPLGESELLDGLPQALQAMDQPTVDGINTFFISRLARELGLKVCLSGLGGDEVFGGYESFRLVPQLRRWNRALGPLPRFGRRGAARVLKSFIPHSDKRAKFMEFLGEEKSSPQLYFLIRALFHEEAVGRLFAEPALAPRLASRFHKRKESLASLLDPLGPEEQVSYLELTHYLVQMLLRDTDVMSMAHGLEVRVPLIDHTLVELMFSVSSSHKWRGSTPKPLLVQSVGGGLPARLIHRKKMGFTLPFESWMRGALKNHVEEVLHTPVAPLTGLLSEPAVRQVWQDFLARRTSWSRPWALYVLKHWVQNNLTS